MTDAMSGFKLRRRLALALGAVMAAGVLAACTDNSSDSDSDSAGASPPRTAEPGAAEADLQLEVLNVGIPGQIPTLNPTENIAAGQYANSLGLETLLRLDQEGNLEPWLATEWEAVSDTVYEYTLREGVKFWDGTEMTSEDVKFSWDQQTTDQPFFSSIESIEAPDPYTVIVNLSEPDASWQYTPALFYGFIYQKDFFEEDPETFGQPGRLIMGTGPWQFDSLTPTTGMELSAFPDYWGGEPSIERISVKSFADENAMALALRAEEIDFAPVVTAPRGFNAATGGDMTTTMPTCATALMGMPTQAAPWDDIHVRRAVAHAINRDDIVAAKQGADGGPLTTIISPMLLGQLGSEDEVQDALDSVPGYEFDLDAARAEMAESSVPDGFEYEFLTTTAAAPVAQVIAEQLSEIGIDLTVDSVGDTEFTSALIGEGDERPLTYMETGACTPDPSWDDLFLGTMPPDGEPKTLNFAEYTPPEVDELQAEGLSTLEPAERLDIYTEILTMVGTDVPYVALYSEGATYGSMEYDLVDFGSYWTHQPWALNLVPK